MASILTDGKGFVPQFNNLLELHTLPPKTFRNMLIIVCTVDDFRNRRQICLTYLIIKIPLSLLLLALHSSK